MYQSKTEAIEALADVQLEIENILEGGVWIDEEDDEFLQDIEAVGQLMEFAHEEISDAIMQIKRTSGEYLDQHHSNYVSLTIIEAKELISKFNILQSEIA